MAMRSDLRAEGSRYAKRAQDVFGVLGVVVLLASAATCWVIVAGRPGHVGRGVLALGVGLAVSVLCGGLSWLGRSIELLHERLEPSDEHR